MRISDWSSDVCSSDLSNDNRVSSVMPGIAHEHRGVDAKQPQCGVIARLGPGFEQDFHRGMGIEPGILGHFVFQLTRAPPGITQRDQNLARTLPLGYLDRKSVV